MSSNAAKRVILYRFDRQPTDALVQGETFLQPGGLEVMLRDGNLQIIDYIAVKAICFAAEGAPFDLFSVQTTFERRPKTAGLWARFQLRDDDVLEGVLPHNLLEWPEQGYFVTPPKANSYRQRVYLPRTAIKEAAMLGLVGKASTLASGKAAVKRPDADTARQLSMFE